MFFVWVLPPSVASSYAYTCASTVTLLIMHPSHSLFLSLLMLLLILLILLFGLIFIVFVYGNVWLCLYMCMCKDCCPTVDRVYICMCVYVCVYIYTYICILCYYIYRMCRKK